MRLRTQISLLLFMFGLVPLLVAFAINVPMIFDRIEALYHKAHLQNLRAEFSDLDHHLARRHEMVRLLAKLPDPGLVVDRDGGGSAAVLEAARAGYLEWVNQALVDQLDITRIYFLDEEGKTVIWLERDYATGRLVEGGEGGRPPERRLHEAGQRLNPGSVMNGPIVFDREAGQTMPNRFMQMSLVSPVILPQLSTGDDQISPPYGSVIVYLDMGGLAQAFRGNYWVLNDGRYLDSATGESHEHSAFEDFQGLEEIFDKDELALWKFRNQQALWVPLFKTEEAGTLWVGRSVDASPLAILQRTVETTIAVIVVGLLIVVFIVARLIAVRAERVGVELSDGITQVLEHNEAVAFSWQRPQELSDLGNKLTRLAETHTEHSHALHAYADELEASNRYKSEFLANVSHELRTPLNSILLLSKMLAETSGREGTTEEIRQARIIHDAGTDLRALIDNILDLSRIEARQMSLVQEPVVLQELIDNVSELMRPQFDARQLELTVELDPAVPVSIATDGEKVRQILLNFLSNAVKFTERGGATLRVQPGSDHTGKHYPVSISVHDTGIGIDPAKQDLVFEAFKQADGSTSRRFGGTGLGLTISRELAILMGGEIELQSEPGSGATFTLYLPQTMPSADAAAVQKKVGGQPRPETATQFPQADYGGARVLLVDDDMRNLLVMTPLLERWKLVVMAAGDGAEALETLSSAGAFELVFMDIMMPGMDGYEVIRRIRQQPAYGDIPIIALTAKAGDEDRTACVESGANDCVVMPVDPAALREVLDRYLANAITDSAGHG